MPLTNTPVADRACGAVCVQPEQRARTRGGQRLARGCGAALAEARGRLARLHARAGQACCASVMLVCCAAPGYETGRRQYALVAVLHSKQQQCAPCRAYSSLNLRLFLMLCKNSHAGNRPWCIRAAHQVITCSLLYAHRVLWRVGMSWRRPTRCWRTSPRWRAARST